MTHISYEVARMRRDELLRQAAEQRLARRSAPEARSASPSGRKLRRFLRLGFAARA